MQVKKLGRFLGAACVLYVVFLGIDFYMQQRCETMVGSWVGRDEEKNVVYKMNLSMETGVSMLGIESDCRYRADLVEEKYEAQPAGSQAAIRYKEAQVKEVSGELASKYPGRIAFDGDKLPAITRQADGSLRLGEVTLVKNDGHTEARMVKEMKEDTIEKLQEAAKVQGQDNLTVVEMK